MIRGLFLSWLTTTALAASRSSPPSGSIVVSKNGGNFTTINDAISSLDTESTDAQTIFIEEGTYEEQVYIPSMKGSLKIYGQTTDDSSYSSNTVTVVHSLNSTVAGNDDKSGTLRNWAANSSIYNLNVRNSYGEGTQAIAVSAQNTEQGYYGCSFTGYQDTLYANTGNQFYGNCYIEGAIDFIFGQTGNVWFDRCDIGVLPKSGGTITAQGRPASGDEGYFVINKSNVSSAPGEAVAEGSYYLGRPWREYAHVVYQRCTLSDVIASSGWEEWSASTPRTEGVLFGEYDNSGKGSEGTRADFATTLDAPVSIASILGSNYVDWVDPSYLS